MAEAIDRTALTAAIAPAWDPADRILPDILDSAALPQVPAWTLLTQDERRAAARQRVAAWTGGPIALRIALPAGPGATLLYAQVAASLIAVGITPIRKWPERPERATRISSRRARTSPLRRTAVVS